MTRDRSMAPLNRELWRALSRATACESNLEETWEARRLRQKAQHAAPLPDLDEAPALPLRQHAHADADALGDRGQVRHEHDLPPAGLQRVEHGQRLLLRLGVEGAEALVDEQRLDARARGAQ